MWLDKCFLLYLLGVTLEALALLETNEPNHSSLSIGVSVEELESPIFYSSFIPLIYEFKLPSRKEDDLRVQWPEGHSVQCNSSHEFDFTYNTYGCPSVYFYNSLISIFFNNTQLTWLKSPISPAPIFEKQWKISCNQIVSHFDKNQQMNQQTWSQYWKSLTNCPGENLKETLSTAYTSISLFQLSEMLNTYYNSFVSYSRNSNYDFHLSAGMYTNAYSAYQALALLKHFVQMDKWEKSRMVCDSGRLPIKLVDQDTLTTSLKTITEKLRLKKSFFDLTILDSDLNLYYKLPLTDCIYISSENNSYVIRTLVPIRPSEAKYKLIEMKAIPFAHEFNLSSNTNLVCSLVDIEGQYVYDESSGFFAKTECKSRELCLVSKRLSWNNIDLCISAVFANNSYENIKSHCKSKCVHVDTKLFPLIKQMKSDKYVVVGYTGLENRSKLNFSCAAGSYLVNGSVEKSVIDRSHKGAALVTIPCQCKMVYKSEQFTSYEPCTFTADPPTVRNILPMVTDDSLVQEPLPLPIYVEMKDFEGLRETIASNKFENKQTVDLLQKKIDNYEQGLIFHENLIETKGNEVQAHKLLNDNEITELQMKNAKLQLEISKLRQDVNSSAVSNEICIGLIALLLIGITIGLFSLWIYVRNSDFTAKNKLSVINTTCHELSSTGKIGERCRVKFSTTDNSISDEPLIMVENEHGEL